MQLEFEFSNLRQAKAIAALEARERRRQYVREWRAKYPEKSRAINRSWNERNKDRWFAMLAAKHKRTKQATPRWVDRKALASIYEEARRRTREEGVQYHVDHIVPIKGDTVCGLHVPWNLQVILGAENVRKSNKISA